MAEKPKKGLTVKQTKLINGIADGKSQIRAAIDAGYTGTRNTIAVTASQELRKPNIQASMSEALVKAGCTKERMAEKVNAALDAKNDRGRPDWKISLDAVKLGCQINKDIGSGEGSKTQVNIFDTAFLDRLVDAYQSRQTNTP